MKPLTKSKYLKGLQCPRLLWVAVNDKARIPEHDEITLKKFKDGEMIGFLATKNFLDGVDLSNQEFVENIENTREVLKKRKPIFEAGFFPGNLYSRVDVLVPVGKNMWDIVEVKSATRVKDVDVHDVSFQKYVCEKEGLKIRKCFVMHVNNAYVKKGEIEPKELFVQTDVTKEVEKFSKGIEKRIENMLKIINSKKEPKCSIGVYCSDPYDCDLKNKCWIDVPEGNVFEFYGMLKKKCFELYDGGIVRIKDVSEDIRLNDKQMIQRRLASDGGKHTDKKQIQNFLNNLKYPIYYLDFETINPAIPKFDGMKPYQRIPFQFSLHIQKEEGGKLKHISFLADGVDDPRPKFLESLKENLGSEGSVLVYNQSFEKGVLRECCDAFPEFEEWYEGNILPRIKDLWDVFRNFYYYDSEQKGSASIKAVLPVMSDLSYEGMEIGKGDLASLEWERVVFGLGGSEGGSGGGGSGVAVGEKKKIMKALEKYCELDTLAEHEIILGLRKAVG